MTRPLPDWQVYLGVRSVRRTPEEVTALMRTKVKAMSYGLAYGLSAFGLSKQLRIESAEAKQLTSDYFSRFGSVRDYLRNVVEQAREDGYTETIFGRRRPFPDLKSPNRVIRDNAERQALNVARMRLLGAEVIAVESGTQTLKDAMNDAMRDWVTNVHDTFYCIGTVAGPHPYPAMVRVLPMRRASRICPSTLLILCAPVWLRSSRLK